jgi:hypothetical protein
MDDDTAYEAHSEFKKNTRRRYCAEPHRARDPSRNEVPSRPQCNMSPPSAHVSTFLKPQRRGPLSSDGGSGPDGEVWLLLLGVELVVTNRSQAICGRKDDQARRALVPTGNYVESGPVDPKKCPASVFIKCRRRALQCLSLPHSTSSLEHVWEILHLPLCQVSEQDRLHPSDRLTSAAAI